MASQGTLPYYYKNSKPVGLVSGPGKTWKDNYLLVVVFVGFVILIAGTFWFLPPLEGEDSDYEKTYGRFTGNAASYITDVVVPSEPTLAPTGRREGERGEGEGRGAVKEPFVAGDHNTGDEMRGREVLNKNPRPPSFVVPPETSRHPSSSSSSPTQTSETARPPLTVSQAPPPPAELDSNSDEDDQLPREGAEPESEVGGASEQSVEEKRRKIIEVSFYFSGEGTRFVRRSVAC